MFARPLSLLSTLAIVGLAASAHAGAGTRTATQNNTARMAGGAWLARAKVGQNKARPLLTRVKTARTSGANNLGAERRILAALGRTLSQPRGDAQRGTGVRSTNRTQRRVGTTRQLDLPGATTSTSKKPTTTATKRTKVAAKPAVKQSVREKAALNEVKRAVAPWASKNPSLELRPAIVAFGGDVRNPITGAGPIEIQADTALPPKAGLWTRIRHFFSAESHSTFVVHVDPAGQAQIMARESRSGWARVINAIDTIIPIRELAGDLLHSAGVRKGLIAAGVSVLAAPTSLLLTGGTLAYGIKLATDGVSRRREARADALTATLDMIQQEVKQTHQYPTLLECYRFFQGTLENNKPGTVPMTIRAFTEKLAINGY